MSVVGRNGFGAARLHNGLDWTAYDDSMMERRTCNNRSNNRKIQVKLTVRDVVGNTSEEREVVDELNTPCSVAAGRLTSNVAIICNYGCPPFAVHRPPSTVRLPTVPLGHNQPVPKP